MPKPTLQKPDNRIKSTIMSIRTFGIPVVFGIREVMPITGLTGKIRLRMRPKSFAVVTQRTPTGVSRWHLKDCGDYWESIGPLAVNHTIK